MKSVLKKKRLKYSFTKILENVYQKASSTLNDCVLEMINIYNDFLKMIDNKEITRKDKLYQISILLKKFNILSTKVLG